MKLYIFELKKIVKQKSFLWLLLLVALTTAFIFQQNAAMQEGKVERVYEQTEAINGEVGQSIERLAEDQMDGLLDDAGLQQLELLKEMRSALYPWRDAIYQAKWEEVPLHEGEFLVLLQLFNESGGELSALTGLEKEIAIEKNDWLLEHGLAYEEEAFPVSPHLVLIESGLFLLGLVGVAILLLVFGGTLTSEKENSTWLTLRTQPTSKRQIVLAKLGGVLTVALLYTLLVIGIGLLVPLAFGDLSLILQYPQVLTGDGEFAILSSFSFLIRALLLFFAAVLVGFSLCLFLSVWIKNSFTLNIAVFFVLLTGLTVTQSVPLLQSAFNPFHLFQFQQILGGVPQTTDWMYLMSAILWSVIFLTLLITLPEKDASAFQRSTNHKPFGKGRMPATSAGLTSVLLFEWRKLRRKGMFQKVMILLVLFLGMGYWGISQLTDQKEEAYLEELNQFTAGMENNFIPQFEESAASLKEALRAAEKENDEMIIPSLKDQIARTESMITFNTDWKNKAADAIAGYQEDNWDAFYEYQLFINQVHNNEFDYLAVVGSSWPQIIGQFTMDVALEEKKWLMEKNIQPVLSGEYIQTMHTADGWPSEKYRLEWEEENRKIDDSGLYSFYLFFENYVYFVPLALLLFVLAGGFASERGKKRTLDFLQTQPLAARTIFMGKTLHSIMVAAISCISLFGLLVLVGTLFNRLGDWNYPVLYYDAESVTLTADYAGMLSRGLGFHFIPLGTYLVNSTILFLFVLLFFLVLANFLSLFLKNTFTSFALTLLIGSGGFVLSKYYLTGMAQWSPFTYLQTNKVANGELGTLLDAQYLNVMTGSLVLLGSTVLLLLVGMLFTGKKANISKSGQQKKTDSEHVDKSLETKPYVK
ncbi:ABC transporter permease subunit [Metaplanococcus flavidus]|uniref:ABC transporter permease subunit n=1 Tax=Metaplanococcus flavidus TaxID=569883 RepID=A0ABW3LE39_9BACL